MYLFLKGQKETPDGVVVGWGGVRAVGPAARAALGGGGG